MNHDDGWIGTYSNHGLHLGTNNGSALFISADRNLYVDLSHDDVSKIRAELKNKYRLFVKRVFSPKITLLLLTPLGRILFSAKTIVCQLSMRWLILYKIIIIYPMFLLQSKLLRKVTLNMI